jgi:hypothetical protein
MFDTYLPDRLFSVLFCMNNNNNNNNNNNKCKAAPVTGPGGP